MKGWFKKNKLSTASIFITSAMLFGMFFSTFITSTNAAFNEQINYQGKLTDASNIAVSDGNKCIKFRMMNAPTAGTELWTEEWKGSTSYATTTSGQFSVLLGSHQTLSSVNFNQSSIYLELQFDPACDGTYEEVFSPRKKLGSVPSAFESKKLGGKLESDLATLAENEIIAGQWNFNATTTLSTTTIAKLTVTNDTNLGIINTGIWNGTTIATNYGGTGLTSFTSGQLFYASGSGTMGQIATSSLGLLTTNVAEGSNLYYTDARSRSAVSVTTPLSYNSSTGAFSIAPASTSANGYLSSTDWTTFNNKESVLTFSGPLSRSVNTISMPSATGSVNGYLVSTDWTTFNNKQNGSTNLTSIASIATTTGNLIIANGTGWTGLIVGANGKVLTASSTATGGISWETAAGGGGAWSALTTPTANTALSMGAYTTALTLANSTSAFDFKNSAGISA
ncbi:hypothetical protein KJ809_00475, partial [Patescibacteria group bacterium]|nr:hypothetical protein [Patescibacteria group bacterium]